MKYDVMAIGVHPDDLEIGIFGTLAAEVAAGKKVLLVDLTKGEMGSNGTPEIREQEAQEAARVIGANRICLGLPDRGIKTSKVQIDEVVKCIRKYRPEWILYPYFKDYHPDHENGSALVKEAIHSSGLVKWEISGTEPWRPAKSAMYYINDVEKANLYIDVTAFIELKKEALMAHRSQFIKDDESRATYLNDDFIGKVITRDAYQGMLVGKKFAEALQTSRPIVLDQLEGSIL